MRRHDGRPLKPARSVHGMGTALSRSVGEFLRLPLVVVAAFLVLAVFVIVVDAAPPPWLRPLHELFVGVVAKDSAPELLAATASSVVAIASITFSVLLLAVQQAATSFTAVVFDQYLRRRSNQLYFGFFVGLSIYAFIVLASERPDEDLAFGATLALALTVVALVLLVVLIYGTIDQMRPATVVRGIHELALRARRRHLPLLAKTRHAPTMAYDDALAVTATESGFITAVNADALASLARDISGEVLLEVRIGSHVVLGEVVARVAGKTKLRHDIGPCVLAALRVEHARHIDADPAYAVHQLGNIAWVAASSAQHNPEAAVTAIRAMADLLARWEDAGEPGEGDLPVVYLDRVTHEALDVLTALAIVSAESRQHQTCAEVLTTFARLLARLEPDELAYADSAIRRLLPAVIEHAFSFELEAALRRLAHELDTVHLGEVAETVRSALGHLAAATRELLPKPSEHPEPTARPRAEAV